MTATIARINRPESWRRSFIAQHGARCHYCNRTGSLDEGPGQRPWHVDHMNPLARGGADSEENLTLACKRCNTSKHATPYEDFKAFARAAWWQERDGVDEGELDSLADLWSVTVTGGRGVPVEGKWWMGRDGEGRLTLVDSNEDGPGSDAALLLFHAPYREFGGKSGQRNALMFILAAHRLVPDLIAEIRQLRAELAEKEVAA